MGRFAKDVIVFRRWGGATEVRCEKHGYERWQHEQAHMGSTTIAAASQIRPLANSLKAKQ
jgi:hypothetical protein